METQETAETIPDINQLRQAIDSCDREMLEVIGRRMALIPKVAEYKKANNIARYQPRREAEVIESRRLIADGFDINPDLAEEIMKLIIKDAHRIEEGIIGE
jgi:chorismate mutase